MPWLRKPAVDTAIPIAMILAPVSPNTSRMTSVAGVVVAASPACPSTRRQTTVTARYSTTTPITPISKPRGRSRRGLRISPLTKLAVCQPP